MADHARHAPHVTQARREAFRICAGMLVRTVDVVEGCHRLASLRREAGVDEWDKDFAMFADISSEIDRLSAREGRRYWSEEELDRAVPNGKDIAAWARIMTADECWSVVGRFKPRVRC
ncbi:hypothetical protein J7J08_00660 [Stenotrophomonas sp. ISL-67]|uniref:hypothetical protein n=1 Tax=Stenotrophomonas sp. ISL-67 TaxID=2819171 RepID=UPI001BE89726|nr:hypothetical protein [Stenotrophomonas sp. ISL-67]MBT2766143.1 hypothetical protein [Stenotrophomonas sp. ISL-67]